MGGAILTPNELVLTFGGSYVCANFGENRSRNATVRVLADGQIHTLTDANRFYNLSHAIAMGQIKRSTLECQSEACERSHCVSQCRHLSSDR